VTSCANTARYEVHTPSRTTVRALDDCLFIGYGLVMVAATWQPTKAIYCAPLQIVRLALREMLLGLHAQVIPLAIKWRSWC